MLFVGNHTPNKGLDVLLRALPLMREQGVAVVAGAITSRADHDRMVADSGIGAVAARLIFTDFITKEELRALYQSVDLFVFPSRADTLPLVILEASACGLPVITTETTGARDAVVPEVTGLLIPPHAPQAIAKAAMELIVDPERRKRMGLAGRAWVGERFSQEHVLGLAADFYRDL